tara:strand:+ start:2728 stop:3948 length:1221 start_codon:yes stop_codon:yes gene_type:complete
MSRYKQTMAEAYKKIYAKEDPVANAQAKLDKAKKIADLKKQISDLRKEAIEPAGDDDHEVSMARGELEAISDKALELSSAMQGMTDEGNPLEAWVQSKITKAKDYVNSVYDYLMYNPDMAKEDMNMDPAKHVARSKRNPDKFCVFDKDGNEVKLFDKEADAIAYAKANHDKLMEELNEKKAKFLRLKFANNQTVKKAERWLYKNMGHANPGYMSMIADKGSIEFENMDDADGVMKKLKRAGFRFKVDMREDLNEFTDAQIARLKKEYEPLKGKETGIALNKFDKLRKILKRLQKPQLLKLVKADLPIVSSAAKARLVINHGMKWSQLPEELVPYIDVDMLEEQKSKFKSVDPKVLARISKMMRGSTEEKKSLANLMNYLMPPEVVDMVRDKFGIKMPRGKIKFTDL